MTITLDLIANAIRNPKHPHQVSGVPGKPKKHRYERRKIKEYLKMGDWNGEISEQ